MAETASGANAFAVRHGYDNLLESGTGVSISALPTTGLFPRSFLGLAVSMVAQGNIPPAPEFHTDAVALENSR